MNFNSFLFGNIDEEGRLENDELDFVQAVLNCRKSKRVWKSTQSSKEILDL